MDREHVNELIADRDRPVCGARPIIHVSEGQSKKIKNMEVSRVGKDFLVSGYL